MTLQHIDRSVALIAGLFCAAVMFVSWGMRGDAGIFPIIASGLGLVASGWLAYGAWRSRQVTDETIPDKVDGLRMLIWCVTLLALLVLIQPIGTYIILPLFLLITIRVLAAQRWWVTVAISVGFTLSIYVVFDRLLAVPLPDGLLAPWLNG
ncbi:tripartite tricarboxylate transporter TctB family protein [Halomonas sp. H2]|uniref:tripartite tricarboxylate transporter TctB family protein n=1 Tax=Halomonas sp. H2 TaxID=261936 RepID=UPI003CF2D803